ncbi:MAG: Gldg family protein [Candidatus Komeilibacteria bacterium]|nr:Gldg family protein [Candidatus Komeilibacteria bacterium]
MSIFDSKRQINKRNALIAITAMLAVVAVVNIISVRFFTRADVTAEKNYSLSATTKEIIQDLPGKISIKAYFTKNLPGYLVNTNQEVRDLLAEFETLSHGNVAVTYLDPSQDQKIEQAAQESGIPTLQFNVVEKDKYQVTNGYLGVAVFYGDKKEIMPLVQNIGSLEYDLAAAISKLTRLKMPVVAWLYGRGAYDRTADLKQVDSLLGRQYDVREFNIEDGNLVGQDIDTLIIPGISQPLKAREQYIIDQFLMRGGSLLLLEEGVSINNNDLSVTARDSGLGDLLTQWGIKINKNLVLDVSNEMAGFRTETVQFFSPYPLWVKITKNGFNPASGIVNKLESLVLTWASSLEVSLDKLTNKTQVLDLVQTTPQAWAQTDNFQLNPQLLTVPPADRRAMALATMLTGQFKSLFSKDSIPAFAKASAGKPASKPPAVSKEEKNNFLSETIAGRLIVVGDADFIVDNNIKQFNSNAIFFQNLVDALSSDGKLTTIRSKGVTDRPIKELSESAKKTIKWLNILGVSALFAGYGLIRFARRRKARVEI